MFRKLYIRIWCWWHILYWKKDLMRARVEYNNDPTPRNECYMKCMETMVYQLIAYRDSL